MIKLYMYNLLINIEFFITDNGKLIYISNKIVSKKNYHVTFY